MAGKLRSSGVRDKRHEKPVRGNGSKVASAESRISKPAATEAFVLDRAVDVIGNKREAMLWMGTPVRALGYATPVSLLATAKGREAVLAVLGRLEHLVL